MRTRSASARPLAALPAEFYARPVLEVAPQLVGCTVVHEGTAGVIVETEAYHHSEAACHAYVGLTARTSTLFGPPGIAYVYRSYGIHALLNAVCERPEVGAAVLIRAVEPMDGVAVMRARRGLEEPRGLCSGPGKLTGAFGITLGDNGSDLVSGPIAINGRSQGWRDPAIAVDRRIGITRAVELPWRFCAAESRFLSRPVSRRSAAADARSARAAAA